MFSFTLPTAATTSAGVFATDGTLLRTLWSNVPYEPGTYQKTWDFTDDDGHRLRAGLYQIRILKSNMQYTWEGVVGNTSDDFTGDAVIHNFAPVNSMAFNGSTAYYGTGYNEQMTSSFKFSTSAPQKKTSIQGGNSADVTAVATDGVHVYWGGDAQRSNPTRCFVFVTQTSDDLESVLSSSIAYKTPIGQTYQSAIDIIDDASCAVTAMAVQKTAAHLFVSHSALNRLDVLNKNTGALEQTLSFTGMSGITVDSSDNLWMIYQSGGIPRAEKFSVKSDGTLTSTGLIVSSGLTGPTSISVSPTDGTIVILDQGSSQLKAYNGSTGASAWTYGRAGGYSTDPDVTADKFYFNDQRGGYANFVIFGADGTLWVGDGGNVRIQHFSADRQKVLDTVLYRPISYNAFADPGNATRVFSDYLEYKIDYSKTLGPRNGSWTLVKNWGYGVTASIKNSYGHAFNPVSFSGHTYVLFTDSIEKKYRIFELPSQGNLRDTDIHLSTADSTIFPQNYYWGGITPQLYADGSLRAITGTGTYSRQAWLKIPVASITATGNPTWGTPQVIADTLIATDKDPRVASPFGNSNPGEYTSSNIAVVFNSSVLKTGYGEWHLGGVKSGTNKWLWKTAGGTPRGYSADYPSDGAYDNGNGVNYGGGNMLAFGRSIFWTYHGEFWKANYANQTNKINQVYDDGLMIGQFGITGCCGNGGYSHAMAQMAGNTYGIAMVAGPDQSAYLYESDEFWHGGVHRWKITGFDTISEIKLSTIVDEIDHGLLAERFSGVDLNNVNTKSAGIVDGLTASQTAIPAESSARWSGFIVPTYSETYTFTLQAPDGVRLYIDGIAVINAWADQSVSARSGTIALTAGVAYPITIEHYNHSSNDKPTLSWQSTTQASQIVPTKAFIPNPIPNRILGYALLEGLRYSPPSAGTTAASVQNASYGWSRNPAADNNPQVWNALSYYKRYDLHASPDFFVNYAQAPTKNYSISRDLGTPSDSLKQWKISGNIQMASPLTLEAGGVAAGGGGAYVQVVDDTGKELARFYTHNYYGQSRYTVNANGITLADGNIASVFSTVQPISISGSDGKITFQYGPYPAQTTTLLDSTANWKRPKKLQISFWSYWRSDYIDIDLTDVYFSTQ